MISISNTGKTLTIGGLNSEFRDVINSRVRITFYPSLRSFRLTPDDYGYKISDSRCHNRAYVSINAGLVKCAPPSFGCVQVEMHKNGDHFLIELPDVLPEARPLNRTKNRAIANDAAMSQSNTTAAMQVALAAIMPDSLRANILIEVAGQSLPFCLPESELLTLALSWAHAGYAVK